jgi:uncharacterized membrane protein
MKSYSRLIVRFALIVALVVTAFYIDSLISKIGLPVKIAVATIIVVMTLIQLFDSDVISGFASAIVASTAFGLASFMFAYLIPGPSSYLFVQPAISIVPRIVIGITSYWAFIGATKAFKNNKNHFIKEYLPRSIGAGVGVLTNTTLVLLMIAIFDRQDFFAKFFATVIAVNFVVEILSALILVPIIASSVKRGIKGINI